MNASSSIEQQHGVAQTVMRRAGIDYTGDRFDENHILVTERPIEAAQRMATAIAASYPEGIRLLEQVGIELPVSTE